MNQRVSPRKLKSLEARGMTLIKPSACFEKVEAALASGNTVEQACREAGITGQTYYRWSKQYGGLREDEAKRLKALEAENARLRRIVSDLTLEKLALKDMISKRL
jgi:putative transposase